MILIKRDGEIIHFCKHCGGTNIKKGTQTNEMSIEKLFKPEGKIGIGPVNMGGSLGSISKSDKVEYDFESNQCQICLNTDVINPSSNIAPLELCTSSNRPIVIIPHLLSAALTFHEYQVPDIYELIVRIKRRLNALHNKWEKLGKNPCKKNRLGYKTTLPLKDGYRLNCWVIVDQIQGKLAYRLVYGGREVPCQE